MISSLASPPATDPAKTRRIELILRQMDSLPTLPALALRLLALTTDEQSQAAEVTELIRSDQALTAKILSICRRADLGIREEASTIDKAVVLLGYTAVRNAVLSIKTYEMFHRLRPAQTPRHSSGDASETAAETDANPAADTPGHEAAGELDRGGFWRHCLAVAIASEQIAALDPARQFNPGEAFVCGLLHDVGKLALDYILPKSFARVLELTEINQGNIAELERRIMGLDHHTAGKRLAEQWQLPHMVQDCIWLHGAPYEMLPQLDHRRLIGMVSLADALVRRSHIGFSGNYAGFGEDTTLAQTLELVPDQIVRIGRGLHQEIERRCRIMGIDQQPSAELYMASIAQANQMLGRVNAALERRSRSTGQQARVLEAISGFHAEALPGRSVEEVLAQVVGSAVKALGAGFYVTVYQSAADEPWVIAGYDQQGRPVQSQVVEPPAACADLSRLDASQPAALNPMSILPWIVDYLGPAPDVREVRLLPLGCGWGTAALLVHNQPALPPWNQLLGLTSTWGAAVAAAGQHDGARRLGEELAQVNRALAETQDRLLQTEALTRLGEMAAGAAHEMNNPLAVISGRAQILAQVLPVGAKEQQAALTIVEQAHRLSDMISLMRLFAQTPRVQRQTVNLKPLLEDAVKYAQAGLPAGPRVAPVQVEVREPPLEVSVDPEQFRQAVTELVRNSLQATPRSAVKVTARREKASAALVVEIADDGLGMDSHALTHAFDPFFSSKPAGRRCGMGLPRAQLLVGAHGGKIALHSTAGKGTRAVISLPLDSAA